MYAELGRGQVGVERHVLPARPGRPRAATWKSSAELRVSVATGSNGRTPRARSACTRRSAPASSSPAVHARPSASISATRPGSSRAATQNPLGTCSPNAPPPPHVLASVVRRSDAQVTPNGLRESRARGARTPPRSGAARTAAATRRWPRASRRSWPRARRSRAGCASGSSSIAANAASRSPLTAASTVSSCDADTRRSASAIAAGNDTRFAAARHRHRRRCTCSRPSRRAGGRRPDPRWGC